MNHQTIRKAAIEILYDNGMVNRFTTEAAELAEAMARAARAATPRNSTKLNSNWRFLPKQTCWKHAPVVTIELFS